jgi:hypothetical protein
VNAHGPYSRPAGRLEAASRLWLFGASSALRRSVWVGFASCDLPAKIARPAGPEARKWAGRRAGEIFTVAAGCDHLEDIGPAWVRYLVGRRRVASARLAPIEQSELNGICARPLCWNRGVKKRLAMTPISDDRNNEGAGTMIVVHHLNNSRSQRILWLLEELNTPYRVETYRRNAKTNLAPSELRAVHPLGKSPVIQDGDLVLAESGPIIEYLLERHGNGRLVPARGTNEQQSRGDRPRSRQSSICEVRGAGARAAPAFARPTS